jgi:hypothetical protein
MAELHRGAATSMAAFATGPMAGSGRGTQGKARHSRLTLGVARRLDAQLTHGSVTPGVEAAVGEEEGGLSVAGDDDRDGGAGGREGWSQGGGAPYDDSDTVPFGECLTPEAERPPPGTSIKLRTERSPGPKPCAGSSAKGGGSRSRPDLARVLTHGGSGAAGKRLWPYP